MKVENKKRRGGKHEMKGGRREEKKLEEREVMETYPERGK